MTTSQVIASKARRGSDPPRTRSWRRRRRAPTARRARRSSARSAGPRSRATTIVSHAEVPPRPTTVAGDERTLARARAARRRGSRPSRRRQTWLGGADGTLAGDAAARHGDRVSALERSRRRGAIGGGDEKTANAGAGARRDEARARARPRAAAARAGRAARPPRAPPRGGIPRSGASAPSLERAQRARRARSRPPCGAACDAASAAREWSVRARRRALGDAPREVWAGRPPRQELLSLWREPTSLGAVGDAGGRRRAAARRHPRRRRRAKLACGCSASTTSGTRVVLAGAAT